MISYYIYKMKKTNIKTLEQIEQEIKNKNYYYIIEIVKEPKTHTREITETYFSINNKKTHYLNNKDHRVKDQNDLYQIKSYIKYRSQEIYNYKIYNIHYNNKKIKTYIIEKNTP